MKKRLLIITLAFSFSFLLMAGLSLFSLQRLTTYMHFSDLMDHSNFVIEKIYDIEKGVRDIDRSERGYLLTQDTIYKTYLTRNIDTLYKKMSLLEALTLDNPKNQQKLALLRDTVALRIKAAKANLNYIDSSASKKISHYYDDSRALMMGCARILKNIHDDENAIRADRFKEEQFYEGVTGSSIKWLLVIFCVITFSLFMVLTKELRERMTYQEELQAKLIDLSRSHTELQEIAYVASHDLQEPLRKIQVFSNMLLYQLKNPNNTEDLSPGLERINNSAADMQSLMTDLITITNLTYIDEEKKEINTTKMLKRILEERAELIAEKHAKIDLGTILPIIGYRNQVEALFDAILDNALKFSQTGKEHLIHIGSRETNGRELAEVNPNLANKTYTCITITDNGIGFDKQFVPKMFRMFQKIHVHGQEQAGKGIGLAVCQRIMANHEGYILAEGAPNKGAKFNLYFPI